eukprot:1394973-Amorphochlora_amoeboformis.AAC.1
MKPSNSTIATTVVGVVARALHSGGGRNPLLGTRKTRRRHPRPREGDEAGARGKLNGRGHVRQGGRQGVGRRLRRILGVDLSSGPNLALAIT